MSNLPLDSRPRSTPCSVSDVIVAMCFHTPMPQHACIKDFAWGRVSGVEHLTADSNAKARP